MFTAMDFDAAVMYLAAQAADDRLENLPSDAGWVSMFVAFLDGKL